MFCKVWFLTKINNFALLQLFICLFIMFLLGVKWWLKKKLMIEQIVYSICFIYVNVFLILTCTKTKRSYGYFIMDYFRFIGRLDC